MRIRPWVVVVAVASSVALVLSGAAPAPAHPRRPAVATASAARIVRSLNAQRRANGIPAGIHANGTWTGRCHKHDRYMALNGVLTHDEIKGKPGYTKGGAWAGQHSVLEYGSTWRNGNPYEFAPIHLAQLLQPRLKTTGAYELPGGGTIWGCTVTLAGYTRPDPKTNRIYAYPGPHAKGVNYDYVANEFPETPNQALHIPAETGEQIFVFASGPILTAYNLYSIDITKATLHPVHGSNVRVRIADALVPFEGIHLGNYLGPGAGIVIPVKPLRPSTRYVASVTMKGNGMTVRKTWSFTTRKKSS